MILILFTALGFMAMIMFGFILFHGLEGKSLLNDIFAVGFIAFWLLFFPITMTVHMEEKLEINEKIKNILGVTTFIVFLLEWIIYLIAGVSNF